MLLLTEIYKASYMLKHVFETSKLIFFKFPKNIKTKLK